MVAVEAARLADTGLPSAALSGGWRISIKAQYLDARKGSDVTAATQDWLLRLASACSFSIYLLLCGETWPNHNVQRWRLRPTNTDTAHGCWPWQFLKTPVPERDTVQHKVFPSLLTESEDYPTHLSWGTFQSSLDLRTSSLLKGFMLPGQLQNLPENLPRLFQTPPIAGCLKALKDCQQQLK